MDEPTERPELISRREYARRKGFVPSTVVEACQQGKISTFTDCPGCGAIVNVRTHACRCGAAVAGVVDPRRGKIDPAVADAEMAANSDPAKAHVRQRWAEHRGDTLSEQLSLEAPSAPDGAVVVSYQDAKTQKEIFAAKNAELDFRKRAGELCEVAVVRAEAARQARETRDAVLAVPDRLSIVLAAETDRGKVHAILVDELTKVLTQISDGRDAARHVS